MRLVFVHGWGCHAGVWSELLPLLGDHEHFLIDLGFMRGGPKGASAMPENAVYIGHSFGVMWLLKHGPRPMRGLVSIAGFDCFYKHVPPEVLPTMQEGLHNDPDATMRNFWAMCGLDERLEGSLDTGALRGGLDWLGAWDVSEERRALDAPILALASEGDRIVRKPMTEAAWGGGDADLRWLATDSHMLPLSHAEWCAEQITGFVDDLDRARS